MFLKLYILIHYLCFPNSRQFKNNLIIIFNFVLSSDVERKPFSSPDLPKSGTMPGKVITPGSEVSYIVTIGLTTILYRYYQLKYVFNKVKTISQTLAWKYWLSVRLEQTNSCVIESFYSMGYSPGVATSKKRGCISVCKEKFVYHPINC